MMLKCIHCEKEFKYESERKRHQESHFPQFGCTVCAKKFSFLSALRRHQKQHERKGSVRCHQCGGSFRDDTLLKRHIQYAHTGTYNCSECSSTFSSEQALRTHSNTHKPESERRFRCTFEGCKKSFNFPHHLKHHVLTHTNAKQHFCIVCEKGFIQSHHLKTHIKTHHPEKIYSEPSCKNNLVTEYEFDEHMITHRSTDGNSTEIRVDSGISSDSNSVNETHENSGVRDNVLCATCGKMILCINYLNHSLKCRSSSEGIHKDNYLENVLRIFENNVAARDSTNGSYQVTPGTYAIDTKVAINEKCMSGVTGMTDCGIIAPKDAVTKEDEYSINIKTGTSNVCGGCVCADVRSPSCSRKLDNAFPSKLRALDTCENNNMPKIDYTKDGIVKIRETFDADIVKYINIINEKPKAIKIDVKIESDDFKYVPFNSCKAVLGNCIVSEDGSVGEGCLCAKMIVDEQQMSAQEIEELTPHPDALWV